MTNITHREAESLAATIRDRAVILADANLDELQHGFSRQGLIDLSDTLGTLVDAIHDHRQLAAEELEEAAAPKTSSVSSGYYVHPRHREEGLRIRMAAEREICNRHAKGRPVIVANVVANHRDEYDAIVRDLLATPRKATA